MSSAVACGGSAVPLPRPPAPGRSRHNPPNGVATTSPNGPARDLNGHSVRCQLPSASQVSTAPWARSSPQCRPPAGAARVPSSSLFSTSSSRPRAHSAPKAERFAPPQARPNVCRVNDVMEIVSGTGVFAKASGQLVNQGTISPARSRCCTWFADGCGGLDGSRPTGWANTYTRAHHSFL